MPNYEELSKFCKTENQKLVFDTLIECGNQREAAEKLGINKRSVERHVANVKNIASLQGYSPDHDMVHVAPDTHVVKGTSTLYDDAGRVKIQWVKTDKKQDEMVRIMEQIVEAMKEDITPLPPAPAPFTDTDDKFLNLYPIADHHIGMLAWHEEGGENYNLKESVELLIMWFAAAMAMAPNSHDCAIANIGDLVHFDGLRAETPTSKNILETDSRFPEVVRAVIRAMRSIISMALRKHQTVHLKCIEGNHDLASSVWLREFFEVLYENEPRVTVDTSPSPYSVHHFGKTMLGFHHGHIAKNNNLPLIFAAAYPSVWGNTEFRYVHVGHRHHQEIKEHSGMTVEQHSTMAPRDSHASRGGWHNVRKVNAITYHREYGEVSRTTIKPEMLF